MAILFLVFLLCAPVVICQRHRILCAIERIEKSPLCTKVTVTVTTTTPTFVPDSNPTQLPTTELVHNTSEAPNSLDYEYFGLFVIVFIIYVFHVLYLHFNRALSWANALGHAFLQFAALYRAVVGRGDGRAEIICCPKIYTLCLETNVIGHSFSPAIPTGVASDENVPL
jgi:hypothetical protein